MKILVYSSSAIVGGHELIALKGLRALLAAGHNLDMWIYSGNSMLLGYVEKLSLEFCGKVVINLHRYKSGSVQIVRTWVNPWRIFRLTRIFRKANPDRVLILQGGIEQGSEGIVASWLIDIPAVSYVPMIMTGREFGNKLAGMRDFLSIPLYRMVARFIVISNYFQDRAMGMGARSAVTVFNTIDQIFFECPSRREQVREKLGIRRDEFISGYMGRIARHQKGLDRLVDIIAGQREFFMRNRVLIVGDGPDRSWLESTLEEKDIAGCVIFLSDWMAEERVGIFDAMDVFVCLSRFEGVPLTMLEAMVRNIPVISTNLPSLSGVMPAHFVGDVEFDVASYWEALQSLAERRLNIERATDEFTNQMDVKVFDSNFVAAIVA